MRLLPRGAKIRIAHTEIRGLAKMSSTTIAPNQTSVSINAIKRDWLTPIELTILAAIWGGSFLFMRVAAGEFGAFALVEIRVALGALVLLPFLWQARAKMNARLWARLAIIGALNSAIPFALFAWGAQRAPAGIGAITNSMAVLFTALVAFVAYGERIGIQRSIALLIGLAGVIVLASGRTAGHDVGMAVVAGTLAALCYGISANMVRRHLSELPAVATAAATLCCAAIMLAPLAIFNWPTAAISAPAWGSAIALGVLCTGIAYAFYFRLIQRVGAPRAVTVTYLVPLFGVAWAWLLLGEELTTTMAIAAALILGSVALSQRRPGAPAAQAR
jgi:drug/metabolite transporter (DMT)-like permease